MKKIIYAILSTLLLFQLSEYSYSQESQTSVDSTRNSLIMATLWYQHSAEMRALCYQSFNNAKIVLERNLTQAQTKKKKAVIVDIDETMLDNSPFEAYLIKKDTVFSSKLWKKWTNLAQAESVPGAVDFVKFAFEKKVEVFYVSNRTDEEMTSTLTNLSQQGFQYADENHMFLLKDKKKSKKERFSSITENYEVLLYVGDNLNDFSDLFEVRSKNDGKNMVDQYKEAFGSKFIILPNPMYGDWENAITSGTKDEKVKAEKRFKALKDFEKN